MFKQWIYLALAGLLAAGCAQLAQIIEDTNPTAPRITRFTATPGAIAPGGSATLSWSVEGSAPITLTLDPGIGDVTGTTSVTVTPNQTTTYTLTATNAQGSDQAQVTVTVGETALNLSVTGLPAGLEAYVAVTNHADYTQWVRGTQSLTGLAPGTYTVTAAGVAGSSTASLASSTTYIPTPPSQTITLNPGDVGNLTVQYAPASSTLYATLPDVPNCLEGSLTDEAKRRALYILNFIRALVGLPPVGYDPTSDLMVQEASLMFAANNAINHFPPTGWACYTPEGAQGAAKSNIAIKGSSAPITPVPEEFIVLWADDVNVASLGHRRWLVDPFLKQVAFGLVNGSPLVSGPAFTAGSAIRVIYDADADIHGLTLPFVAYPRGEFPTALFTNDWFFSFGVLADPSGRFNNGGVDYSQAQIRVTDANGTDLSVTEVSFTDPNPSTVMGLPNHLQWKVPAVTDGMTYTVTITNVRVNGTPQHFSYTVHLR